MKYLSHYTEQAQTKAFDENGAFFAFGNKQFEEQKKEGIEYISIGAGLICPKENAQKLIDRIEKIQAEAIKQDTEENGATKIIEREYFNHETQLTGDRSDMLAAISGHVEQFPNLFTEELIKSTCKACFDLAVKNDWF